MKPWDAMRASKAGRVTKWYSRPFCSPARGERVVSGGCERRVSFDAEERRERRRRGRVGLTGDGEAECVRVGGEEAFEDGGFAGAGGAGDDDWAVG